jgi:hypothetical protein
MGPPICHLLGEGDQRFLFLFYSEKKNKYFQKLLLATKFILTFPDEKISSFSFVSLKLWQNQDFR